MKRKCIKAVALAAALVSLPVLSFAAGSVQYGSETGTAVVVPDKPTVVTAPDGSKLEVGAVAKDPQGTSIALVLDAAPDGTPATMGSNGERVTGNVAVGFVGGTAATAGLPETVVSAIDSLTKGVSAAEVLADNTLSDFKNVGAPRAIVVKDAATNQATVAPTKVTVQVDTLPATVQEAYALCYDNATGQWIRVPATVNPVTKTVSFEIPGSCTVQIVVK